MAHQAVIAVDLADVFREKGRKKLLRTVAWGDEITVLAQSATRLEIRALEFRQEKDGSVIASEITAYLEPTKSSGLKATDLVRPVEQNEVLRVNFVDVQQGDAAVIESPDGKVILVDGGDNQMFARYLAGRFRGTSKDAPKEIACILVTHGDADHFSGLVEIHESEHHKRAEKRIFIRPRRVYHNGLVKRPSKRARKSLPETKLLGATAKKGGELYLTGLESDLLRVPDAEMNLPFRKWKKALAAYDKRGGIEFRRLKLGDDDAFEFFKGANLRIEVLGPIEERVDGKPALRFLGEPPKGPRIGHESLDTGTTQFKGHSASHTINGHSIVFRLVYGGFSYLFSGDLNDEASRFLVQAQQHGSVRLRSEILKVPHHGSADFSGAFMQAVSPVVNVVSSGDESARKEYIHPRATLMGALGKCSRVAEPLVFVTELVAFFNEEGWSRLTDAKKSKKRGAFYGFSRTAYGIVKTRTDGRRFLVYTDSGNLKMKEAYAYTLDAAGEPRPAPVVRA